MAPRSPRHPQVDKPDRPKGGPKRRPGPKPAADGVTDAIRAEIVMRLASYDTVKEIRADLLERGIDLSRQAISTYNPMNGAGSSRRLAQKWVDLFNHTREQLMKELAAEPIASRVYRLRRLRQIHERAMDRNAWTVAAAALEQAAKEMGSVYTNVAKVTGNLTHRVEPERTPEENRIILADKLKDAFGRLPTKH